MYIERLHIRNLRCFRGPPDIELLHPDRDLKAFEQHTGVAAPRFPNVNLLLGDNGVGKTTILKALALGVLAPVVSSSGYVPHRLLRRGPEGMAPRGEAKVSLRLHPQDTSHSPVAAAPTLSTLVVQRGDYEMLRPQIKDSAWYDRLFEDDSPAAFMVGYGATRRVEATERLDLSAQAKLRKGRYQRVAGIFEDHVALTPLGAWLPKVKAEQPPRFQDIAALLNTLLDEHAHFTGDLEGYEYIFEHQGARVPFSALSDGYRGYIGWIADLLFHLQSGCSKEQALSEMVGIVLVDEVDLHLHPSWQRTVVPALAKALPRLQFVLTTHSPVITGTLQAANIIVMDRAEDGAFAPRRLREQSHGLNADQILLSSYFGMTTTRAPDAEEGLSALSRRAREGDSNAAMELIRRLAPSETRTDTSARSGRRRPAKKSGSRRASRPSNEKVHK